MAALEMPAIQRLASDWARVSPLHSEAFETLKKLVAMKANHAGYRLALHVAHQSANATAAEASSSSDGPPLVIPLLRVLLHDLFALHEIQRQAKKMAQGEAIRPAADAGAEIRPHTTSQTGNAVALDLGALKTWYIEVKQTFKSIGTRSLLGIGSTRGFTKNVTHDRPPTDGGSGTREDAVLETLLQARVSTVPIKQLSALWNAAEAIEGLMKARQEPFANPRRAVEGLSNIGLV